MSVDIPSPEGRSVEVTKSGRRILTLFIALAIAARVLSALYQANSVKALPGIADQVSYHELALRVLGGHGFSFGTPWWPYTGANQPTAHWSFLYVLFLSAVYYLFGPDPLAARLIQAVLAGILQPLLTWRIARRLFGPSVGLVSAALTSLYGYFIYYSGALMTEALYIVAVLWVLDIATDLTDPRLSDLDRSGLKRWALLGIALGTASLLRQVILILAPVILTWAVWQVSRHLLSEKIRLRAVIGFTARRIALTVVLMCAAILPWTIRNYRAFGRFVLLNTNAGFAFFWGNHPIHGTEFIPILSEKGPGYGALIPAELRALNEAELDKALLRRGLNFVREDPIRYIRLSVSRLKEYFRFWPSPGSSILGNYVRILSFGVCFPFMLAGLMLAYLRQSPPEAPSAQERRAGVTLLAVAAGTYTLLHLLSWTLIRYRLPVDAVAMPFAAFSLVFVYDYLVRPAPTKEAPLRRFPE